jgi:Integrase core domain
MILLSPLIYIIWRKTILCSLQKISTSKKSGLLDLVHSDLYSMRDRIIGGALYFVTFVDDNSKKIWTYYLKSKDQVSDVFKQWVVEVERETEKKVKCIRLDNGGKYRGSFEIFYKTNGIKFEKTIPKTP